MQKMLANAVHQWISGTVAHAPVISAWLQSMQVQQHHGIWRDLAVAAYVPSWLLMCTLKLATTILTACAHGLCFGSLLHRAFVKKWRNDSTCWVKKSDFQLAKWSNAHTVFDVCAEKLHFKLMNQRSVVQVAKFVQQLQAAVENLEATPIMAIAINKFRAGQDQAMEKSLRVYFFEVPQNPSSSTTLCWILGTQLCGNSYKRPQACATFSWQCIDESERLAHRTFSQSQALPKDEVPS